MRQTPVSYAVEDAAGMGDLEMGKGNVARGHPTPVDGGDVTVAHDGLAEGVDTVV